MWQINNNNNNSLHYMKTYCEGRIIPLILNFGSSIDKWLSCMISGFSSEVDENCNLLRYYAAKNDDSLPTYRATCLAHRHGSRIQKEQYLPLKVGSSYRLSRNVGK